MSAPQKIRVIVTRPEPDASRFAEMLAGRGMTAIASPVLRIEFRDIGADLSGAGAVAFTSANGVRSYLAAGGAVSLPAFAVGGATAAEAREGGFASVQAGGAGAADLMRLIAGSKLEVLHVVGRDEVGDLTGALAAHGIRARRAVGYAAEPVGELTAEAIGALKEGGAWVAHFSARSARLFRAAANAAAVGESLKEASAACLSAAVAEAAGAGWRRKAVAERPASSALIDAIAGAR